MSLETRDGRDADTDPWERTRPLRQGLSAFLSDRRVLLPVLILLCSHFTPLFVFAFHPVMSRGVQNVLFFWPQYGLYPYASHFRVLSEGGWGGNPLGLPGVVTSVVHWLVVLWLTRRLTTRSPILVTLGVFAALALLSLVGIHLLLPLMGFEQQLEGP